MEGGHPLSQVEPVTLPPFEGAKGLAELARKEVYDLTHGAGAELAVDLLGLLTAAACPSAVADLLALLSDGAGATGVDCAASEGVVAEARSPHLGAGWSGRGGALAVPRTSSLLEYAQDPDGEFARDTEELRDPKYREWIHRWAQHWRGGARWGAQRTGKFPATRFASEHPRASPTTLESPSAGGLGQLTLDGL